MKTPSFPIRRVWWTVRTSGRTHPFPRKRVWETAPRLRDSQNTEGEMPPSLARGEGSREAPRPSPGLSRSHQEDPDPPTRLFDPSTGLISPSPTFIMDQKRAPSPGLSRSRQEDPDPPTRLVDLSTGLFGPSPFFLRPSPRASSLSRPLQASPGSSSPLSRTDTTAGFVTLCTDYLVRAKVYFYMF